MASNFSLHTLATLTILFSIFAQIQYCHISKGFSEEWYSMKINTLLIWSNIFWFAISARKILQKKYIAFGLQIKIKKVNKCWAFLNLCNAWHFDHFSMRLWACSKDPRLKLVLFFWSSVDSEWGQCLLYCKSWTEPMSSCKQYLRATKPAALVWQSSFLKFPAFPVSSPQSKIRQIGWLTPAIASSLSPPLSPVSEWSFLRTPPWSSTWSATSPPSPPRWSPGPWSRWSPPAGGTSWSSSSSSPRGHGCSSDPYIALSISWNKHWNISTPIEDTTNHPCSAFYVQRVRNPARAVRVPNLVEF